MNKLVLIISFFFFSFSFGQDFKFTAEDVSITPLIDGTLIMPDTDNVPPLAIIIAGSGPVDRNGNQMMMENNSLKFLAEGLGKKGIASFRYDKRIVKIMKRGNLDEKKIDFNHFIEDAVSIIEHFGADGRFSHIVVVGHSQGSLVGMVAAQGRVNGFVSLAGAGQPIDDVIVDQLGAQAPGLKDNARSAFDDLRTNGRALNYSPGLSSIFRQDIQPFIYSWMQYNPAEEILKLEMPVLIVNGDKDLQVQVTEAEILKAAKPDAELAIVSNMNHILKEITGNDMENSKSYNEYNRPVMSELIDLVSGFILQ